MDVPALRSRVLLKPGLRKYRDMFRDLSAQREYNQAGIQSIDITAINSYLDIICERRPEHRKFSLNMVLSMDAIFMEHIRKKQEQNQKKGSS